MPNCCHQAFSAQLNVSPQNKNSSFAITYCCNFILHLIFSFKIKECVLAAQGKEKSEHRKQRQLPAFNVEIFVYNFFLIPRNLHFFFHFKAKNNGFLFSFEFFWILLFCFRLWSQNTAPFLTLSCFPSLKLLRMSWGIRCLGQSPPKCR